MDTAESDGRGVAEAGRLWCWVNCVGSGSCMIYDGRVTVLLCALLIFWYSTLEGCTSTYLR